MFYNKIKKIPASEVKPVVPKKDPSFKISGTTSKTTPPSKPTFTKTDNPTFKDFKRKGISFDIKLHADKIPSPAVFIINHSSTLDLLTLLALGLPKIRFVAKWQFQYNPIFLLLGRLTGQIFIRRKDSEKAIAQLQKTYQRVQRQQLSIMMAPEGSRSHPGIIGPFKKGPFRMAMDLDYPIVPIYFEGNQELSKGGTLITKSGKLTAHIHKAIDLSEWNIDNLTDNITSVRSQYVKWAGVENDLVKPIA